MAMNFIAVNKNEFDEKLRQLEVTVPLRGKDRTTDLCEQWQIHALLVILRKGGYLRLPFSLIKRDRPDFKITSGRITLGIEAIEAINSDYARAQTLPEYKKETSVLVLNGANKTIH